MSYHISILCSISLYMTMIYVHVTDTGWLPLHDTTTINHSIITHNMAIWARRTK